MMEMRKKRRHSKVEEDRRGEYDRHQRELEVSKGVSCIQVQVGNVEGKLTYQ